MMRKNNALLLKASRGYQCSLSSSSVTSWMRLCATLGRNQWGKQLFKKGWKWAELNDLNETGTRWCILAVWRQHYYSWMTASHSFDLQASRKVVVTSSGAALEGNEISIPEGLDDQQLISTLDTVKDVRILHFKDVPAIFKGFTDPIAEKSLQVCPTACNLWCRPLQEIISWTTLGNCTEYWHTALEAYLLKFQPVKSQSLLQHCWQTWDSVVPLPIISDKHKRHHDL